MADLAIIIVSTNEARWLTPCLTTVFERAGKVELDVVVADNSSTDGTSDLVAAEFPAARVVTCHNHGFGHANNSAYLTTDAPFVLFMNPDTEVVDGTFEDVLAVMHRHPEIGVAGVKQITADGELFPTIRRFPTVSRYIGDALGAERLPVRAAWMGERVVDMAVYERPTPCDWVSGSYLLVRREALEAAGIFDERFFVYAEEVDLCRRIKTAGWQVVHLPTMTIIHHADKAGWSARVWSQDAYARRQYLEKHFGRVPRAAALTALTLRLGLRAIIPGAGGDRGRARRAACRSALATLYGRRRPPFEEPPGQALWPRH
ncbi:MAG: glycosyltransferase family 2 protein [Gaiella sp.]